MMENSFNTFLSEYQITGKSKIDGYSLANLDRLTNEEKDKAYSLLKREMLSHPPAIVAMAHINPDKAEKDIKDAIESLKSDNKPPNTTLLFTAYKLSKDCKYIQEVISARKRLRENHVIPYFVDLCEHIHVKDVEDFIKSSILAEVNSTVLSTLSRALLAKHGHSTDLKDPTFQKNIRILKKGSIQDKSDLIESFDS